MKYRLLTNVKYVDHQSARLWCHAVAFDLEPTGSDERFKMLFGLGPGGIHVFTIWIDPDREVEMLDADSKSPVCLEDGQLPAKALVMRVHAKMNSPKRWQVIELYVARDDWRTPFVMEDLISLPFGDEFDRKTVKFAGGINYPRVVWTRK